MYYFEKSKYTQTRSSATTRYKPWRSRCAEVKRQLLGKWPRGLPHLCKLRCSVRVCARANLRPNLETKSGEVPCLALRLRSGRSTPFRWIFRSWKLSEPTFVSTCSVRRSYYCRRILYRSRSMAYRGTTNSRLNADCCAK